MGLLVPAVMSFTSQINETCSEAMKSQWALALKIISVCYGIAGAVYKERENGANTVALKKQLVRGQLIALLRSIERKIGAEYGARFRANVMVECRDGRGRYLEVFSSVGDYSDGELEAKLYQEGGLPTGACGAALRTKDPVYVSFVAYGLNAESYSGVLRPDGTVPFNIPEAYWGLTRSLKAIYSISLFKDEKELSRCGVLNIDFLDPMSDQAVEGEFTDVVMQARYFIAQVM